MPEIEYVDHEPTEIVEAVDGLLAESDGSVHAAVLCTADGMHLLMTKDAGQEEIENVRLQISGLLEHFDELVAATQKDGEE